MIYLALTSAFIAGYFVRSAKAFVQSENKRMEQLYRETYYTRVYKDKFANAGQLQPSAVVNMAVSTEDFLQLVRNTDGQYIDHTLCMN